jgi:SAM-dependent methyltransferase
MFAAQLPTALLTAVDAEVADRSDVELVAGEPMSSSAGNDVRSPTGCPRASPIGQNRGMPFRRAEDRERFAERHRLADLDVMKLTELAATGSDYGASGYTTMTQVEELARRLALGPDDVVLDLGSGTGWPGLHLVKLTGCSVIVSDPVGEGPRAAQVRAGADDVDDRAWAVPADGRALPFRSARFDAVVQSDALC